MSGIHQTLNSYEQLSSFLSGDKEILELEALPKEAFVQSFAEQLYYGKWKVAWIWIKAPFLYITSLFLSSIAKLLACCCCPSLSRTLYLSSCWIKRDWKYLMIQELFGSRLLIPANNRHQMGTSDVYNALPIQKKDILSARVRSALEKDQIELYNPKGNCRGASVWFNHLFLRALDSKIAQKTDDPVAIARAVALQFFESGIPRQAAVLQSTCLDSHFFPLEDRAKVPMMGFSKWSDQAKWITTILGDLDVGVYSIWLGKKGSSHAVSLLQLGEQNLVFDPNRGLFKIDSFSQLLDDLDYLKLSKAEPIFCLTRQGLPSEIVERHA